MTKQRQSTKEIGKKAADIALQDIVELSVLFDFYSELLGERNRDLFRDYLMNDLSLGEISQEAGISRQGVYDIIKRSSKKLYEYEEKLGLKKRFEEIKEKLSVLRLLLDEFKDIDEEEKRKTSLHQIEKLLLELQNCI